MGGDSAQKDADGAALLGLQPGTMQLLLPGEDIKFSDPADVGGSYESFQYRTLLACCAAMGRTSPHVRPGPDRDHDTQRHEAQRVVHADERRVEIERQRQDRHDLDAARRVGEPELAEGQVEQRGGRKRKGTRDDQGEQDRNDAGNQGR